MNDKVKIWIDEALAGGDETVTRIIRNNQPNSLSITKIPKQYCYKCDVETTWIAPDGRCGDCTGYTPEEIRGEV